MFSKHANLQNILHDSLLDNDDEKIPVTEEQSGGVTSKRVGVTTVSHVNCVSLLL
jgi:hypothetical protein